MANGVSSERMHHGHMTMRHYMATWLKTWSMKSTASASDPEPMNMHYYVTDVLANFIITMITKFRMVAERIVHRREGPQHKEQQRGLG
eukprot:1510286-Amphidinium_carterae.1